MCFSAPTSAPTKLAVLNYMCNARAHARIVALVRVPPLRARARHGALLCSDLPRARSRATGVSLLEWGSTRAPVRDRAVNVCCYITNPLLLSIPQLLNLGGILRTKHFAHLLLRALLKCINCNFVSCKCR